MINNSMRLALLAMSLICSGTMNYDSARAVGEIMQRALGEGGHTPNESRELDSMPLAIKRAAILIHRLSQEAQTD